MALDVIVLAAGLGKRMRSDLPKVLHPLAGRPLLAHVIDAARALAPRKIFVVHGHGADRVRAAFPDSGVDWVLQAQQLGTGHAVLQALPQVSPAADVLILYDDVPVVAVKVEDQWEVAGVNSMQELAVLERVCQGREARRLLDAGVTLADPARIDVRGALECGRDVSIDVNCVFEGRVRLGDNVRVGPNCVLKNVSIGAGTEVLAFSHLDDAAIGERCRVGPFARLRPGANLAEDVHVGNFVEVKASHLGAGSKANHLSYIGDSEVGSRVNVGAGTITCNYDGATKHRTVIEDDCFIGSDATLVAPVRIARGSYIGAGSTISKDTPPGQLTVARARQVSIPSWKPPRKKG